jgi:hypothetical protein
MIKAFIGASAPIAYCYNNEKEVDRPNPILDSPLGLFLFYDEIWFLNRKLCPYNMQGLPYVFFLDEEYDLSNLDINKFRWEDEEIMLSIDNQVLKKASIAYRNAYQLNVRDDQNADNHGRGISLGNGTISLNSTSLNLIIDDMVAKEFNMDLILNSSSSILMKGCNHNSVRDKLAHKIICDDLTSFQLFDGPYHPYIEDLRTSNLLKDFRKKLETISNDTGFDDIEKAKAGLVRDMNNYFYKTALKEIDKNRIIKSSVDIVVGNVPILSTIYSAIGGGKEVYDTLKARNEHGWVGFVAQSKLKISDQ